MENEGAHTRNNDHDLSLSTGTHDTAELILDLKEYDMDALLGDDDNASTDNDAEGSKDKHPERGTSSKHKRHTLQQIQALEGLFQSCTHPDEETRKALGAQIGMGTQQIRNWFQNRRSQIKVKSCSEENSHIRVENDMLKAENTELRKKVVERTCFSCLCLTVPTELLTEKQRLLIENARLKEEYQRAKANLRELSRGAPPPLTVPGIAHDRVTLLLQHGERAMKEFLALAAAGEPMWKVVSNTGVTGGEVLNDQVYDATFPRLLGPCPEGFVSEGTRETAIVFAAATDLVATLTDAGRWSETFPGIVAAVSARGVDPITMLGSSGTQMQLINAEFWVQSPRVLNRSVKLLRLTKMTEKGRQWAVVDVSVDAILAGEQQAEGGGVNKPLAESRLLPSGCLIEEMNRGFCKVTWIVHAEYNETVVPPPFRPLVRSGQALGARRWLSTLIRQCEFNNIPKKFRAGDWRRGVMEVARRMSASFYAAVSGPITMPSCNICEWHGGGAEAAVRMVVWNCPSGRRGGGSLVLSATTTVWLPSTPPQLVLDYLRDERRRGEWDLLADGAPVNKLASIITGNHHGNTISLLRPARAVTDDHDAITNNRKMLILQQEVCSDKSFSMVVSSFMEEKAMLAIANGADPSSGLLLPSGFVILPDGRHRKTTASSQVVPPPYDAHRPSSSSSNAHNSTTTGTGGCLLTAGYQTTLWPANPATADAFFDVTGKKLCCAIKKIKSAVRADAVVPL